MTTAGLASALPTGFSALIWANDGNTVTPYLGNNPGLVIVGNDSSATPTLYNLIFTATQLQAIGNNLAGNYALANNIDMTGVTGFTPIGRLGTPFTGSFNGLGNVISNLTVTSSASAAGLFGQEQGMILNVGLIGGSVTGNAGNAFVGGLAGYASGGTITNVYATGSVTANGSGSWSGGLVGENQSTIWLPRTRARFSSHTQPRP